MSKLGTHGVADTVRYALEHDLVKPAGEGDAPLDRLS